MKQTERHKPTDNVIYMPMMTVSEAARYMGVGKKIIYQLIEFDEIRAVRH